MSVLAFLSTAPGVTQDVSVPSSLPHNEALPPHNEAQFLIQLQCTVCALGEGPSGTRLSPTGACSGLQGT